MTALAAGMWEALAAAGGSLALSFIVALALGIASTAVLFFGSAVVVLERFARAVRRPTSLLLVSLVWAGLLGTLGTDTETFESFGGEWPGTLAAWAFTSAAAFVALVVFEAVVGLLLRFVQPRALGLAGTVALGCGFALLVGSLGQAGYVVAPALIALLAALLLRRRRVRAGTDEAGADERLAWALAVVLVLGVPIPFLVEGASPELGRAGGAILLVFLWGVLFGLLPLAAAGLLDTRGTAEWFIARRYLFAKRRQTFISVITAICVAGVAVGVWLIITVLSVMNGFERTWREEIIGNRAHLTVHNPLGPMDNYAEILARIDAMPDVTGASPYLDGDGMVRGPGGAIVGVRVRGIDPARIGSVTDLRGDLMPGSEGALDDLAPRGGENGHRGDPGIVIGSQLASTAGVSVGDELIVISPFGGPPTPLGPAPRLQRFRVAGVFQTSFFQYDEVFTYVDLETARDYNRAGDVVQGIEVRTTDYFRSARVARAIERELGFPYFTRDWKEFFPSFFQALKTERVMMFVLLTMVSVVASFAIVVTLVMMIMEKSSDIAILKAMGATDAAIERIFALEGTLIGLLGTALGVAAAMAVTTQLGWVQRQIEALTGIDTLPASIYQFSTLPTQLDPGQIAIIVALSMVLALGATLLPSRQGARLDPAEALRYE